LIRLAAKAISHLEQEIPLRNVDFTEQEMRTMRGYTFLSQKPLLVVVNADESDASKLDEGAAAFGLETFADKPATGVVALSARVEEELAHLDTEDATAFRADLGIRERGTLRLEGKEYLLKDGEISHFRFNV